MIARLFHRNENAKRRGDFPPGCSRFTSRRGVTLVELMIAMLILTIVCLSWLKIIGIQSARKEARRREAVERLAGMMDAFMYDIRSSFSPSEKYYEMQTSKTQPGVSISFKQVSGSGLELFPVFDENVSPIGYRLGVVKQDDLREPDRFGDSWGNCKWLVGELYDRSGCLKQDDEAPFFYLQVCLGL